MTNSQQIHESAPVSQLAGFRTMALLVVVMTATAGCTSIGGMQDSIQETDLHQSICPSGHDIDEFNNKVGSDKRDFRDRTILDCIKAIDAKYKSFEGALQQEAIESNLIPDVLGLGLNGAAALTKGKTAKQFTQGALAVVGIGAAVNKDVFYQQTLPAIESSMDAKRYTILTTIINSEKNDPNAASYTLTSAGLDIDSYEAAGNIYTAISELTTAANKTAQTANDQLNSALSAKYDYTDLSKKIEAFWMPDGKSVNSDNQTKLQSCMKTSKVAGSIPYLINAGTDADRALVITCLKL